MADETNEQPLQTGDGEGIQVNAPGDGQPTETPPVVAAPAEQAPPAQPERVKLPEDPVSIRCKSYTPGPGEKPVDKLVMKLGGKKYIIPVGGVMQNVIPRRDAEKFILRAKRYWTASADLEISEPSFG